MKQLTKEQAILFGESQIWVEWSDEEIVKFQLFQDKLCMPFSRFHKAVNVVLDRPVFTHEFTTSNHENLIKEYLGEKEQPTFEEVVNLIPKDKRVMLKL